MINELSAVKDYHSLQEWLNAYCEERKHPCWHNYGPADFSLYQADPVKILLVNAESGGYEECQAVPADEYLRWIRDGWRTPRYSSVFVSMMRDYISHLLNNNPIPPFDRAQWSRYYRSAELLVERMLSTIYMNASVTSNGTCSSAEDKGRVLSDVVEFAPYRKQLIEILHPRIIICAGDSAKRALFIDNGAFPAASLCDEPVFANEKHIFVILPHLSRPYNFGGYKTLNEMCVRCAELYVAKTW